MSHPTESGELRGRRYGAAFFILAVAAFAAARLWHLAYFSLDGDEIFSVNAARMGWAELLSAVVYDVVHPPLFYMLLKVWMGLGGDGLLWLRLFPVTFSFLSVAPVVFLCRELRLRPAVRDLALLLTAVNGYLTYYVQHVRMYSLLFFLTACSLWLFVRFVNRESGRGKNLLVLFAVNLLLVYTQYFGWLVVGTELAFLLLWHRARALLFFCSVAALALTFAPWAYAVARAAAAKKGLGQNIGWITRPRPSDVAWYYASLNGSPGFPRAALLSLLLFGLPVLLWCRDALKSRDRDEGRVLSLLLMFSFLPTALAFAASQALPQSLWGERHLIIVAAPYLLLVSAALWRLRPTRLKALVLALAVCWASVAGLREIARTDKKIAWESLTRELIRIEPATPEPVAVYTFEGFVAMPLDFYLKAAREERFQIRNVKGVGDVGGEHFWVAFRDTTWTDGRKPQELLKAEGYSVGDDLVTGTPEQRIILFPVWRR